MDWKRWTVLGLLLVGFGWTPAWFFALALYEFGVRRGRTVTAFWASGLLHGRGRGQ